MNIRLIPLCAFLLVSCPMLVRAADPPPGAPVKKSATTKEVVEAANFAIQARQKADSDAKAGSKLELVKILGVEEQVVAGINYKLTLRVKQDGKDRTAEAKVWWQVWRKPDPYQLTSWTWIDDQPQKAAPGK